MSDKVSCFCWNINYTCNYRCPYCFFFGRWEDVIRDDGKFPAKDWIEGWRRIYDSYGSVRIETAGGEPFTFPSFTKCINEICKMHSFRITTNLSCSIETLKSIIDKNSPERLKWNISFHPSFTKLDDFLKKAVLLKHNNFDILTMYVAYPPQLSLMPSFRRAFQDSGITFFTQAYQGEYNGKIYPQGYTDREGQMIGNIEGDSCKGGLRRLIENQLLKKQTKGKLCLAGHKYAFVDSTGIVYRCTRERKYPMGNFLESDFKLNEGPLPCEFEDCPCEFTWLVEEGELSHDKKDTKGQGKVELDLDLSSVEISDKSNICQVQDKYPAPGRVYWCWDIHNACNYKCGYCWLSNPHKDTPKDIHPYPGTKELIEIWTNIYKRYGKCHVHISGGEPAVYPSFFELLAELSLIHAVEFDTNLSFNPLDLIRSAKSDMVKIDATIHPEFVDSDTFFSKVIQLRDSGFIIGVACVGYPPYLDKINVYRDISAKNKIEFNIQAFRGEFNGKEYPLSYEDSEKEFLGICPDVTRRILKHHTVDGREKIQRLCRMGQMGAKIYPSGDVFRCCIPELDDDHKIGNIFKDRDFRLFDKPRHCEKNPCPCWRAMIVGKEKDWDHYWFRMEKAQRPV